jgi:hypothetical protein
MSVKRMHGQFRRVWLWPSVLGIAGLVGLISALVGDGVWDVLSWITLGAPLLVVVFALRRQQPQ